MRRRSGSVAVLALTLLLGAVVGVPSAIAGPVMPFADPEPQAETRVEVPFRGQTTASVETTTGEGTSVVCEPGDGSHLKVTCSARSGADGTTTVAVVFVSVDYAKDVAHQRIPVTITGPAAEDGEASPIELVYDVTLLPPAQPSASSFNAGYLVTQGSMTVVPITDFYANGVTCEGCTARDVSPTFTFLSVSPKNAGSAAFLQTGLRFQASSNFSGEAVVSYQISDPYGQGSEVATVAITVVEALKGSTTPVAVVDTLRTSAGKPVSGNVLDNDIDPTGSEQGLTATSVSTPANGTATFKRTGVVTYVPNKGFKGIDQFTYQVANAEKETATGIVVVGVDADPGPVANSIAQQSVTPSIRDAAIVAAGPNTGRGVLFKMHSAVSALETSMDSGDDDGTDGGKKLPNTGTPDNTPVFVVGGVVLLFVGAGLVAIARARRQRRRALPESASAQ